MKSGYTLRAQSSRMRKAEVDRNILAEHVANGGSLAGYAEQRGISTRGAERMWSRIRSGLGWQAS